MSNHGFGLATNSSLIFAKQKVESRDAVITALSDAAIAAGFATDEFRTAILAREKEYPTGLPTSIPMAIPHIHDGCQRSFLSCMTLVEPVEFASMDGDSDALPVRIVFCFGITEPKQQAQVLQKLAVIFQDAETLKQIADAEDSEALLKILSDQLADGLVIVD